MRFPIIALCICAITAAQPAFAQSVTVQFRDGAPKDSITITNAGCAIENATFTLDLAGSAGALIFDTTAQGAGVEVFQPVEILSENVTLCAVTDGDTTLDITVAAIRADNIIRLTADLDDTIAGGRQITVTGSEIAGATVTVSVDETIQQGAFDATGAAMIDLSGVSDLCTHS